MNRHKRASGVSAGSVTLVVVFCVLALAVFASLSLSSAVSEYNLAKQSAEAVTRYYEADLVCTQYAAHIRRIIQNGETAELEAYCAEIGAGLGREGDRTEVYYEVPIDDNQALSVVLSIYGDEFVVDAWKVVGSEAVWMPDDTLNLWTGDEEIVIE